MPRHVMWIGRTAESAWFGKYTVIFEGNMRWEAVASATQAALEAMRAEADLTPGVLASVLVVDDTGMTPTDIVKFFQEGGCFDLGNHSVVQSV